ncbi:glycosyltransferase [Lentzea sp. NPDC051838]|uniref:glycosyltransferase n=1 Tax=Lentzea sp. NPDC051838 TaxID=3154849 RepID=UPI0034358E7A
MTRSIAGVVIPAHNEERGIARCLEVLLAGTSAGELDVVVVANACDDATADVARAAGVRVVETAIAGKVHAMTLGDKECSAFPRLYLDADVDLDAESLRAMVSALADSGALACSPVPELDLEGAGRVAKGFHRAMGALLADRRGLSGTGAYLLAEIGHSRVFPMPEIINDDGYVQRSFSPAEKRIVPQARAVVRPARTVSALVRRRARVRLGNRELDALGLRADQPPLGLGRLRALVRAGEVTTPDAACFLAVLVVEKVLARWRSLRGEAGTWSADRTTR